MTEIGQILAFVSHFCRQKIQNAYFSDRLLGLLWDSEVGLKVAMPNGHVLQFKKGMTEKDALSVAQDYDSLLRKQASKKRVVHVLFMFVWWVVPLIALYIVGWTVGWVYRGFTKSAS